MADSERVNSTDDTDLETGEQWTTFDAIVGKLLPPIDEALAKQDISLALRPHQAACLIVDHFIASIEGESKERYLVKPWFGALLAASIDWYELTYGAAIKSRFNQEHTAVAMVRHTPTALQIPLVLTSPIDSDNTLWITLATGILPGESPIDWLVRPPRISALGAEELERTEADIAETCAHIRRISGGVLTISKSQFQSKPHADRVLEYLAAAAQDILSLERSALSSAIWDANFAAENSVKCYLHQAHAPMVPNSHDVRELAGLAPAPLPQEVGAALAELPSGRHAVMHRYGQLAVPTISDAMKVYRASMVVCQYFLNLYPRKIKLDSLRFKLGMPPMPRKGNSIG